MKKARIFAGAAAIVPTALAAAIPATTANATTNGPLGHNATRTGKTLAFGTHHNPRPATLDTWASVIHGPAPLYSRGGRVHTTLGNGSGNSIYITCYYSGNTGFASDPYWDHFIYYNKNHFSFIYTGHMADHYANLLGHYPKSFRSGIKHC